MRLIVGLGNPGDSYRETRHNAGRVLVEHMAKRHKLSFAKKRSLSASVAKLNSGDVPVIFAYPETFMNLSGQAVAALVREYEISVENELLIVIDDVAIPYGKLRLRGKGTEGGHNGLRSITGALLTSHYARLRMGIGELSAEDESGQDSPKKQEELDKYVLAPFKKSEKIRLPDFLERAAEACNSWLKLPLEKAMNVVNANVA